ncbi:MAG: hypothetical protein Q9218_005665 [Villophora microphyllina]
MASSGSIYSQALHNITHTKLDELDKKRKTFAKQRHDIISAAEVAQNPIQRIDTLKDGVSKCFAISTLDGRIVRGKSNYPRLETILRNLERFLAQARYDPSISPRSLDQWQQTLLRQLEVQALKFEYASLYGQLTKQWLSVTQKRASTDEDPDLEMSDFEHISAPKSLEYRINWDQGAFTPSNVDRKAVEHMLQIFFKPAGDSSKDLGKALDALHAKVKEFERDLASPQCFNTTTLDWTIKSLLASDLLADSKRDVLRDFLGNTIILKEVADVLNMRMMALDDWSWGEEVLLEKRRQLNGTYKVYMDEDVLQAIFLHYIGIRWSVFWKRSLRSFRNSKGVWKTSQISTSLDDRKRREFYLGPVSEHPSYGSTRLAMYRQGYFLSQLLDSETEEASAEEGDEEADFEPMTVEVSDRVKRKLQTARKSQSMQAPRRQMMAKESYNKSKATPSMSQEEKDDLSGQYKPKNAMDAKQSLLHLLSAETFINTRLQGEITCFRSQIENLYSSLAHDAIECIWEFFGVSSKWLGFIHRFLKAPLRFADDESSEPRQRKNGVPGSHVLSEVFAELVLFCLDSHINQVSEGELLWRTNDDFWFWSSSLAKCEKAWSATQQFVNTVGLTINKSRSGSVRMARESNTSHNIMSLNTGDALPQGQIRWGMLYLNPDSGRFEIDQSMVDKHIGELSHQLQDKTNNIFAWIKAWNSYAATFFTSNFGKPANCFGQQHVDDMLATHERIQRRVFSSMRANTSSFSSASGSVVQYLKQTIAQQFGTKDIPDGYFYFPTELGGLEVRNPFIGLLQIRETVQANPDAVLDQFEDAERDAYKAAQTTFSEGKLRKDPSEMLDPDFRPADAEKFLSFEEYTKYRESLNYGFDCQLRDVLLTLLKKPDEEAIETEDNGHIMLALNELGNRNELRGITSSWYSMEAYWKWVAQLYGPAMIEKFGGLSIVDPGLLPMGMVSLFKSGRVNWQD